MGGLVAEKLLERVALFKRGRQALNGNPQGSAELAGRLELEHRVFEAFIGEGHRLGLSEPQ